MPLNRAPQRPPVLNSPASSTSFSKGGDTATGTTNMANDNHGLDHSSSSNTPSSTPPTFASLRTKENIYLLALLLLLTLIYIAHQAIQRRTSQKKAFQRKARLLGISSTSSSATSSSSAASSSSSTTPPSADGGSVASIFTNYARVLAGQLHLDGCLLYIRDVSSRLFKLNGREGRRRRKSTSNGSAETDLKASNGSANPSKALKNSSTEHPSVSQSKTPSSSSNDKHTNAASSPATTHQGRLSARPNGPSRHASSNQSPSSASSSRSRSATQSAKQQQQQLRASSLSVSHASIPQDIKPVMKSIGVQVEENDLLQAVAATLKEGSQTRNVDAHPGKRKGKSRDSKAASLHSSSEMKMSSLHANNVEDDASKTGLEVACSIPLPPSKKDEIEDTSPDLRVDAGNGAENGLGRSGTITYRSSRSTSRPLSTKVPASPSVSLTSAKAAPSMSMSSSETKPESCVQSPTCSSSGRSTSLSVSTDATGMTSLHPGDQDIESVQEGESRSGLAKGPSVLQPSVDLKEAGQTPRKQIPNGLQYSFHSGFQEATTLEGERQEQEQPHQAQHYLFPLHQQSSSSSSSSTTGLLEANTILQHADGSLYLPSPPDSQRKIRVDALGYPSIPLPSSSSSTNSSANNSPSAARRAVSVSRSPSAMGGLQSPVQDRRQSNANLSGNNGLQDGMYPVSLGVQSMNTSFPSLPMSPPPRMSGNEYQNHQYVQGIPYHSAPATHSGVFPGPPLASPHSLQQQQQQSGLAMHQQQQYITQAQYQYQHLLQQPQAQQSTLNAQLHPTLLSYVPQSQHQQHQQQYQSLQSPAMLSGNSSAPSPGLLNPLQVHVHSTSSSSKSGGGSSRSSTHQSQRSASSRPTSPHPSNQSTASYSTEPSSIANTEGTPSRLHSASLSSPSLQHGQMQAKQAQYIQQPYQQQQQQQQLHMHSPAHHTQSPQHLDLVQKMLLMQAQIQYAMQQNEAQNQQAQVQAAQQQQFFQSASGVRATSASVPQTPLTAARPGITSPLLYPDGHQQGQSSFMLSGLNSSSSASTSSYPVYQNTSARSQSTATSSSYGHISQQQQQQFQHYQSPTASGSKSHTDGSHNFPSIRRRQSTPALGADVTMAPFSASQVLTNGSPYMTGKKRTRRHSKPFRLSSYGQAPSAQDSPDFMASPVHDTSAHYDAEVDMSTTTTSSSHASSRPNYDRRRSSLVPPTSPLLNGRKDRRNRQKERERERSRQMELDDEEVTNNEDDIKADLEILAQMQHDDNRIGDTNSVNLTDIAKRLKSMETVLERRGKELEIAKWKLKCVEVDRRSIEAEHQKALTHFYERAERAEARLRLLDSAVTTNEGSTGKSSPEVAARQVHETASVQGEITVPSEVSHAADTDSSRPAASTSFSSTTPHLAYSTGYCSPTSFNAATYAFSDSPYTSSKYPPHPFASEYKTSRTRRKSPRMANQSFSSGSPGARTLSPRDKSFRPLPSPTRSHSASQEDSASSENSDSDEDIEILLDSSYSRSPSLQPSVTHSRVPSGGLVDSAAVPSSTAMVENRTVGLGIEASSSSSDEKPVRKSTVDFVGSLPSFTISQPPSSSPSSPSTDNS